MRVNLVCALFVLGTEKNSNIRKNDIKKIKVLLKEDNTLPKIPFLRDHMKSVVRENIKKIINFDKFYLEQVFTHDFENEVNIVYLGITNEENIKEIDNNYKLVDFSVKNNKILFLGNKHYFYFTKRIKENNSIEDSYSISASTEDLRKTLLDLLVSYQKIRNDIDNTDILFKFFDNTFTLEDLRIVYELITETTTDKSNFRKKMRKSCEPVNEEKNKTAYRPSQKFKYKEEK